MEWFLSNTLDLVRNLNNFDTSWHFAERGKAFDPIGFTKPTRNFCFDSFKKYK